ncbi:MAG: VWA domain-containing protein [Bryobacterales bacterium]|nr:VWA domain-containing protein [Bryobacterales bacterium]
MVKENRYTRRELLLSLAALAAAQEPTTFSTEVRVVNLLASVRNKRGEIIRDLKKDDFLLKEDGRPQTIRYFAQESDLPLTIGLLVDTSRSQRRVLKAELIASIRFLRQVLREDHDRAFVMRFEMTPELLQNLTPSRSALEAALVQVAIPPPGPPPHVPPIGPDTPRRRGGPGIGTALYDAIVQAANDVTKKQTGRKALVLMTDGVDAGSTVSLNEAIEAAQRADTLIYSIFFYDTIANGGEVPEPFDRRRRWLQRMPRDTEGGRALQRLSKETGGGFFEVSDYEPIEKVFSQIEEELRRQYSLGYVSDQTRGGGYRKITLAVNRKGLLVQTRDGYYAAK